MYGQYTPEAKMIIMGCIIVAFALLWLYAIIENKMTKSIEDKKVKQQRYYQKQKYEDLRKKYISRFEIRDFRKNFKI